MTKHDITIRFDVESMDEKPPKGPTKKYDGESLRKIRSKKGVGKKKTANKEGKNHE